MSKITPWFVLIYGLIVGSLGYLGYKEAASKASLLSGLIFGSLLICSSFLLFAKHKLGSYLSVGTTLLLSAVFCYRYFATHKGLPGILAILSASMLVYLLARMARWK